MGEISVLCSRCHGNQQKPPHLVFHSLGDISKFRGSIVMKIGMGNPKRVYCNITEGIFDILFPFF